MVLEQTPQCPGVSLSFLILSPFLTDPLKEGTRSTLNLGRFVQTPTESSGVCGRGLTIFDEPLREGRETDELVSQARVARAQSRVDGCALQGLWRSEQGQEVRGRVARPHGALPAAGNLVCFE